MKAQTVTLAILAASACDEPGCGVATVAPFVAKLSCPWKVTSDDLILNKPIIRQSNPGRDCEYKKNGLLHFQTCEQCGNSHVPCENTFTACTGCCQSGNDIALREHDCNEVKDYFRWKNECPLKLMEAGLEEEPDTSATLRAVIKNHTAAKVLAEGNLSTSCKVKVEEFKCPKIPAIVEFDCMQCNIGSADLMAKCCNECVRFSTSETLANVSMIEPFVVCNGCQTETIKINWKGTIMQQPWIHAGKYDNYSRKSQEDQLDKWVEKKICNKLANDTCADPPRKSGRLLREAVSTTTTTTREALAEQCRRLGELNNSATLISSASTTPGAAKAVKGDVTNSSDGSSGGTSGGSSRDATSNHDLSGSATAVSAVSVLMAAVIVGTVVLV